MSQTPNEFVPWKEGEELLEKIAKADAITHMREFSGKAAENVLNILRKGYGDGVTLYLNEMDRMLNVIPETESKKVYKYLFLGLEIHYDYICRAFGLFLEEGEEGRKSAIKALDDADALNAQREQEVPECAIPQDLLTRFPQALHLREKIDQLRVRFHAPRAVSGGAQE